MQGRQALTGWLQQLLQPPLEAIPAGIQRPQHQRIKPAGHLPQGAVAELIVADIELFKEAQPHLIRSRRLTTQVRIAHIQPLQAEAVTDDAQILEAGVLKRIVIAQIQVAQFAQELRIAGDGGSQLAQLAFLQAARA